MKPGKRTRKARERIDPTRQYSLSDAVDLARELAGAKFDETIEISMNLGVDPRHADQNVRGIADLPHGSGKKVRVAVFARGALAEAATGAGADHVGAEEMADQFQKGTLDVDRVIASPDMMGIVGRLGRVLGPKGLMPNPRLGTVTADIAEAVTAAKAGRVQFRAEKAGIVHAPVGKASFSPGQLCENAQAFARAILQARPSGAKGSYVRSAAISSTMGPGVSVELTSLLQS